MRAGFCLNVPAYGGATLSTFRKIAGKLVDEAIGKPVWLDGMAESAGVRIFN
jgi:hypothetical protein